MTKKGYDFTMEHLVSLVLWLSLFVLLILAFRVFFK